jgi:hypothetical protein
MNPANENINYEFNLDVKNILVGQIPYLYHYRILKILNFIVSNFKTKS